MKNLIHFLGQDPVSGKYGLMPSGRKHKPNPEDHFNELQKTTRFRNNHQENIPQECSPRKKNPFKG